MFSLTQVGCNTKPLEVNMNETEKPVARATSYDKSFQHFGAMLRSYTESGKKIYVQVKPITNETASGSLPSDLTRMVTTALIKIGKPIVVIPYDPTYLNNEMKIRNSIAFQNAPDLVISGAISEFDENLMTKNQNKSIDISIPVGKDLSVDASKEDENEVQESRLAIDLDMLNYLTQESTGAQTSNTLNIRKETQTSGWAFSILGVGMGEGGSLSKQQGIHAAIRHLVELSVIQLIGREFGLPYWKVLNNGEQDDAVMQRVSELPKEIGAEQFAMRAGIPVEQVNGMSEQQLVSTYLNRSVQSSASASLYTPRQLPSNMQAMVETQTVTRGFGSKKIKIIVDKEKYRPNDEIKMAIMGSDEMKLSCFLQQGRNELVKILPNRFLTDTASVSGNVIQVPGSDEVKLLISGKADSAKVTCFGSDKEIVGLEKIIDLEVNNELRLSDISEKIKKQDPNVIIADREITIVR